MQIASVNGIHIHYRLQGSEDKPLLVFVNSLGTDFRIWDRVVNLLQNRFRILLYDKRGHGLSAIPDPPYTIDDHVNDLAGLLAQLGLSRAFVCGVSVGGMIALGLAAKLPKLVQGLILSNTAHQIGPPEIWDQRIDLIRKQGLIAIVDNVLQRWFSPEFRAKYPDEIIGWRSMVLRSPVAGYIGTCQALRDADLTKEARALRVPTLCLAGDKDGSTPPDLVHSLSDLISGSRFELIQGAGHLPGIQAPDRVADLNIKFIGENHV